MKLTLSLKEPPRFEGADPTYVLQDGSTVIGRAPDAGWRLPDPERVLSKTHCRIDAEPHGFIITDLSTNGAFVNGEAVGYERRRLLADGDRLRLGDVDIAVSIEGNDQKPPASDAAVLTDGPFGNEEAANQDTVGGSPSEAATQPRGTGDPIKEDWWAESAPDLPLMATKGVDSEDQAHANRAGSTVGSEQAISPTDAIVMSLVQSFPSLDAVTLASAVDAAGARIPEAEWQGFYERLRAFLRERYPDSR